MLERDIDMTTAIERSNNPYMNSILGWSFPVLDHGFIRCIDWMGDDAAVVQAARVSYGTGTKHVQEDRGLIRYLMRHWHTTPFEMCEIKLHVKLPIFTARQWIRHRTANVNENSARYSLLDREFYIPEPEHMAKQSTDNKQGRSEVMTLEQSKELQEWMLREANKAYDGYLDVSNPDGHYGLARELARMNLPANIYTQWYWKVNLHNLFHFLRLRADAHAQYEIRAYAEQICNLITPWVPHSYDAFRDYRLNAKSFSAMEMNVLKLSNDPEYLEQFTENSWKALGLTMREAKELIAKLR